MGSKKCFDSWTLEEVKATDWGKDYEFALCIGGPRLNAQKYVDRALELEASGKFKIYKDLKKMNIIIY